MRDEIYIRESVSPADVKLINEGKCPSCNGKAEGYSDHESCDGTITGHWRCWPCRGTGKPTARDLMLVAQHESGLCTNCLLPREGETWSGEVSDHHRPGMACIAHVMAYAKRLEARIAALEGKKT